MLNRLFVIMTMMLAIVSVHQYNTIDELRANLANAHEQTLTEARAKTADSMQGTAVEMERTMTWLDSFYRAPEGLRRTNGISGDQNPDFAAISVWVFDTYLRLRLQGATETSARETVEAAIRRTPEWQRAHGQS
jgi:hypothetical protein